MSGFNIRNFLHQLRWDKFFEHDLEDIRIILVHRGAPNDEMCIAFNDIEQIDGNFMLIKNSENEEVQIPIHRILEIVNIKKNIIYWKKPAKINDLFKFN
jgi:uncharacterized protein (UPF0248 family)